jgi:hypothetical protein
MADALHRRSTRPHTWHTMPVALQMIGQLWRGEVSAEETLLELVRERLRLTGMKRSCESQVCGASGRAGRRAGGHQSRPAMGGGSHTLPRQTGSVSNWSTGPHSRLGYGIFSPNALGARWRPSMPRA